MRRRIAFPGIGILDFVMRLIVSALIFNVVSVILKQLFDEQERRDAEEREEKVIDVSASQVMDA
jgi:hypothetical protein